MTERRVEFCRALGKLAFLNTLIIYNQKEYIIYFQPMESKGRCKIQVTNGFDFWVEDFDLEKFEQKRKKSGLEGTYNSYFDMMHRSISQRNFEVYVDQTQNFVLTLYFQLNKGVSLKGDFELGRPLHFDDIKEFHCVYRLFLFDIFKAKDQERMKAEVSRKGRRLEERESKKSISQPRQDEEEEQDEDESAAQRKKKVQL
ncbi:unnamed protein product [Paramecium primaurelia]|uniref:Uncharacterized protein n=1 Tax=Paramecium primaurelia TaxID=5886 RepID=A0A8S1MNR4_PARPR|nr:unnamed protein product [Paramecium primaurelia]